MNLQSYVALLRRYAVLLIVAPLVVALVAGLVANSQTREYRTTARIMLVGADASDPVNQDVTAPDPEIDAAEQIEIIQSGSVLDAAAEELGDEGLEGSSIEVSQSGETNILDVSVTDADPQRAAAAANAIVDAYIADRRDQAVAGLQSAASEMESRLDEIEEQIASIDEQLLAGAPGTSEAALNSERTAAAVQYESIYGRLEDVRISISLQDGGVDVVERAEAPSSPVTPKPVRDAAIGGVVGLLAALGVVLLLGRFDDRIHDEQELLTATGSTILARVPRRRSESSRLMLAVDSRSPEAEAVRGLRTAIQFLGVDEPIRRVLVTSPGVGDGKTTVAANLALAFARAETSVALVSADLRRPRLESTFGIDPNAPGLSDLIREASRVVSAPARGSGSRSSSRSDRSSERPPGAADAQQKLRGLVASHLISTDFPLMRVLPAGTIPPDPSELLGAVSTELVFEALGKLADIAIIDSPPGGLVTDPAVLSRLSDGTLLVVREGATRRGDTKRCLEALDVAGARLLGVVSNASRGSSRGEYYDTGPSRRRFGLVRLGRRTPSNGSRAPAPRRRQRQPEASR